MVKQNSIGILFFFALSLVLAKRSDATLIQILHTNDLHASLMTAGAPGDHEIEYGGWAQLKHVMDKLTDDAKARGIETVRLDAGDYTEGTSFYFADKGMGVIKAFQHLGYDATAMGNHDWLMGAEDMDAVYQSSPFPFPVLSANAKFGKTLPNLREQITPSTQIVKSGIKIGIFGLSTDEILYNWIPRVNSEKNEMKIQDYHDEVAVGDGESGTRIIPGIANTVIQKLRQDNDVVIGLTHIGYEEDKYIAANSQGLDLIIGAHSHTFLDTPTMIEDRDGASVPIVQTGFNGKYVGKILLDVEPGEKPKLVSYDLVPILHSGVQDPQIAADVAAVDQARSLQFGPRLNEVIGKSDDRLVSGDAGPTSFSEFVVDSIRDVTDSELAIDVGAFHGNTPQLAGDVTRLKLMEMYPRKFEAAQNEGLYIYKARIPGIMIKIGIDYIVRFGLYVATGGLTYELNKMSDVQFAKAKKSYGNSPDKDLIKPFYPNNLRVNGAPIKLFKWYSVAVPESLARGALAISSLMPLIIHDAHPTEHTIWDAMNFHLLKIGKIKRIDAPKNPLPWSPEIPTPRSLGHDFLGEAVAKLKDLERENPSAIDRAAESAPSPTSVGVSTLGQ